MVKLANLFSEGRIGSLRTKNRIVMPAMVLNYADEGGRVTQRYEAHMNRIATGGVGTIILEASFVSQLGKGFVQQLGIHDDECVEGLRRLAATAQEEGVLVGPQLHHAGRQTSSQVTGGKPLAPSPLPCPLMQEEPDELTQDQIAGIVADFGEAARRAKQAGFDFVELHGAHGYLIAQFLSPFTNRRDDGYGGSFDNRMRFVEEVFDAVRAAVGSDFPVIVRLSGEEFVEDGLSISDTVAIARRLQERGLDALHITAGNYASYETGRMISPMAVEDGPLTGLAEHVRAAVDIPVITVDKLRSPELGDRLIAEGVADFIAIGRPLLADPDWPRKAQAGSVPEINLCIACNQGCVTRLFMQKDVWCTVNPRCGHDVEFAEEGRQGKLKVLVIGGGPAGMSVACEAARHGHLVVLCERGERLGGQLFAAEAAPHRVGWTELRRYLSREVESLEIEVRLSSEATADMVRAENADIVVVATGARNAWPDMPGLDQANAVFARDILEGKVKAEGRVIIAGGGCNGAQTAEFLAEAGHPVTLLEQTDTIAEDAPTADRALLLQRLERLGVRLVTDATISQFKGKEVLLEKPDGSETLSADTIVLALGSAPENALAKELEAAGIPALVVGDAHEPRKVTEAMLEGALAGFRFKAPSGKEGQGRQQ